MSQDVKAKIEAYNADRVKASAFFKERSETYRAFLEMDQKTFQSGALAKGHKELIATAISIVINCEPCMEWHIREAIGAGMTDGQIIEAMEVAFEMGGGPATVRARFALSALEHYRRIE